MNANVFDMDSHRALLRKAASELEVTHNLAVAREIACELAEQRGAICADDVVLEMEKRGLPSLGPASASIFRGPHRQFEFTGKRIKSVRPSNHHRELKQYRLTRERKKGK